MTRCPVANPRPPADLRVRVHVLPGPRELLGWSKRCKLTHAFLWECSYTRLEYQTEASAVEPQPTQEIPMMQGRHLPRGADDSWERKMTG